MLDISPQVGHGTFHLQVALCRIMDSPLSRRIAVHQLPTKLRSHRLLSNIRAIQLRRIEGHETLVICAAIFFLLVALLMSSVCMVSLATVVEGVLILLALLFDIGTFYILAVGAPQPISFFP